MWRGPKYSFRNVNSYMVVYITEQYRSDKPLIQREHGWLQNTSTFVLIFITYAEFNHAWYALIALTFMGKYSLLQTFILSNVYHADC